MSFDTECDLALEAERDSPADDRLRETIVAIRNDRLSEHLGVEPEVLGKTLEDVATSLLAAIEKLRGTGRTLRPFEPGDVADDESAFAENELLDPEQRSVSAAQRLAGSFRDFASRIKLRRPDRS